jgi:hypothetical protein
MSAAPFGYPPGTLDAAGRVAVDAACTVCKYNLRSLEPGGYCPECGQPVAVSLREWGRYLRHAPLPYLRKLVRGTRLIVWAVIISIASAVVLWVVSALTAVQAAAALRAGGAALPQPLLLVNVASWVVSLGVMVMIAFGLVCFTARDPRRAGEPEPRCAARRTVRYALAALPVTFAAAVVVGIITTFSAAAQAPTAIFGGAMITALGAGMLHGLNYVVLILAGLRHARNLMRQVPNPGLASFATALFWGACVVGVLMIAWVVLLFGTVATLMPTIPAPAMMPTTAPSSFPITPGAVGYTVIITHDDGSTTSTTYTTTAGSPPLPATVPANAVVIPSVPPPAAATPTSGVVMVAAGGAVLLGGCGAVVLWIAALIFLISLHRELGRTLKAGIAESGIVAAG